MKYIKYIPSEVLKNFVECYFIWRSPAPRRPMWIDSPPSAYTALVFNLANPHAIKLGETK